MQTDACCCLLWGACRAPASTQLLLAAADQHFCYLHASCPLSATLCINPQVSWICTSQLRALTLSFLLPSAKASAGDLHQVQHPCRRLQRCMKQHPCIRDGPGAARGDHQGEKWSAHTINSRFCEHLLSLMRRDCPNSHRAAGDGVSHGHGEQAGAGGCRRGGDGSHGELINHPDVP